MDATKPIQETNDLCTAAAQGDLEKISAFLDKIALSPAININEICNAIKTAMIRRKNVTIDDQRRKEIVKTILTTPGIAELITTTEAVYILIKACRYGTAPMLKMLLNLSNPYLLGKINQYGAYQAFDELVLCNNQKRDKGDLLSVLLSCQEICSLLDDGGEILKTVSTCIDTRAPQPKIVAAFFGSQHLSNLIPAISLKEQARRAIAHTIIEYKKAKNLEQLLTDQNMTNLLDSDDWSKIFKYLEVFGAFTECVTDQQDAAAIKAVLERYAKASEPEEEICVIS